MAELTQGITVKKDVDFSEWYTQVIQKAELIEYTDVSGCIVFRPRSYAIWEKVSAWFDLEIKKLGVQNSYFPLFIPEKLLTKEAKHVEGFAPEVAWVTMGGHSVLPERLAVRPTSETVMYDNYAKWVQSYRDLPLKLNQWCNVVRWEFKHAVPFLRTREFLWQEGHTAFATKKEADKEVLQILDLYRRVYEELYACPAIVGRKSESEKFAGADYTMSVETFVPSGKSVQAATSHHLGQNFSKAFNISFLNEKGDKEFAYQNSWGMSTRTIGVMIMMHSDDKGLVIPPRVAPQHGVIVPILFGKADDVVLKAAKDVAKKLKKWVVSVDDRDGYSAGFKYNDWEMKGVPIRVEIGPRDVEKSQVVLVRRDTGKKEFVAVSEVVSRFASLLDDIQQNLFDKAKAFLESSKFYPKSWDEFASADKKLIVANWCNSSVCEEQIKEKTGVKTLNIPFEQPKVSGKCIHCDKSASVQVLFARSY